ncbi:MAG: hypothetical protein KIB11_06290 [Clostridium perfringens]|nr:hypothetical protein [Clostridium perfringens]MBS5968725.1 hypothetical protein [Clostridium perfringens]MDM0780282.1 hypothetical protein [Clostridium perfringens]
MIKRLKNNDIYSNEQKEFMLYVQNNKKIKLDIIDVNTIQEIDIYINNLHIVSRDILEESIKKRVKNIELDINSYIGATISIASLQIAVVPILLKYINAYIAKLMEVGFAFLIIFLISKIYSFYFMKKKELLFNNFVLNRINNLK